MHLYRAVEKRGGTVDFPLKATRELAAARRYLELAINQSGLPENKTVYNSGVNTAVIRNVNHDACLDSKLRQFRHLNNIIEQADRAIKRITKPMLGFKSLWSG